MAGVAGRKILHRSKLASAASSSASVAPSAVSSTAGGRRRPAGGRTGRSLRLRRLLPLRPRGAPPALPPPVGVDHDQDGGETESIRSEEIPPSSCPRLSRRLSGLMRVGGVDDGAPSLSVLRDLKRVLAMIDDERHLVAHDLYLNATSRIDRSCTDGSPQNFRGSNRNRKGSRGKLSGGRGEDQESKEEVAARALLNERQEDFQGLENRAKLFSAARENLSVDDDWIHAQTLFGISTFYRRETDGSLSVKIEGELHGVPLFEQLVVLRECDLYHTWAPFTSKSKKLAQLDKLDVVAWYMVGVPMLGLTRDACYRAVGCDCMRENGSVLLVAVGLNDTEKHGVKDALNGGGAKKALDEFRDGALGGNLSSACKSAQGEDRNESNAPALLNTTNSSFLARDAILSTLEIPPIPHGIGRGRMTIRNFVASIDILAPSAARTKMVVNVDPNLQLIPQFMIDFSMKRMCGILLLRLQSTARKVVKDPIKNAHARRMREDVRFYRDWLLPKFRQYCDELGWEMPAVGAFDNIQEDDLQAEGMGWIDDNVNNDKLSAWQCQMEEVASCSPSFSKDGTVASSSNDSKSPAFLKHIVRAKAESREEKIAEARLRAAKRLQPRPFPEEKAVRLRELKAAKHRTDERRQRVRALRGEVSSGDSASTLGTAQSFHDDLDTNAGAKQYMLVFACCFLVHTALLSIGHHPVPDASQWAGRASREALDFMMILLQTTALRALLISVLIYAFDEIDFGQKELVANMDYGKKYYINEVKKYSLLSAVSVATVSCGLGLAAGSISWLCSFTDEDVNPQKNLNASENDTSTLMKTFFASLGAASMLCRHMALFVPGPLQTVATDMIAFVGFLFNVPSTRLGVCKTTFIADERWGYRALGINSFISLRLGVFVLALMLMGHVLLPKPANNTNKNAKLNTDRDGRRAGFGLESHSHVPCLGETRRNISSMEAISEENF